MNTIVVRRSLIIGTNPAGGRILIQPTEETIPNVAVVYPNAPFTEWYQWLNNPEQFAQAS